MARSRQLTAQEIRKLKPSDFALPKEKKYPIHEPAAAKAALKLVAKEGTPEEVEAVETAVYKRYPELDPAKAEGKAKKRNDGMNDLIRGAAGRSSR